MPLLFLFVLKRELGRYAHVIHISIQGDGCFWLIQAGTETLTLCHVCPSYPLQSYFLSKWPLASTRLSENR